MFDIKPDTDWIFLDLYIYTKFKRMLRLRFLVEGCLGGGRQTRPTSGFTLPTGQHQPLLWWILLLDLNIPLLKKKLERYDRAVRG